MLMQIHDRWLKHNGSRMSMLIELLVVLLTASLFAWYGHSHGGQILGTDTLGYLDKGLRSVQSPAIMNRYTHIYILRAFGFLSKTPLEGMRAYSAFVTFSMISLMYYSARLITRRSSPLNGVIAVGFFLGQPRLHDLLLIPMVDTTVMLIMLIMITLYVIADRNAKLKSWSLFLLGVFFILALRTKETSIVMLLLILGISVTQRKLFDYRRFIKDFRYVAGGMALALLIFIIANTLLLNSPFFGLRPTDFLSYQDSWSENIGTVDRRDATFSSLVLGELGILFLLYVGSGLLMIRRVSRRTGLIWVLPLALLTMLILFTTRTEWNIVPRGFMPGAAIMCLLAGNFASQEGVRKGSIRRIAATMIVTLLLIGIITGIGLVTKGELAFETYFYAAFVPLTLSAILAVRFLFWDNADPGLAILILLIPISLYPVRLNVIRVNLAPEILRPNYRFQPILEFGEAFTEVDSLNLYVSSSLLRYMEIHDNRDELMSLINVALDLRTARENYQIGTPDMTLVEEMEAGKYTHVLITSNEWDWLRTSPQDRPEWRNQYFAVHEPTERFILLSLSEN